MHHVGHPKIQGLTCSTPRPSILQSATASSKRSVGREVQRQMPGGYLHRKMVKGLLQSPQKHTSLVCRICLSALDKVQIGTLKPYQNGPHLPNKYPHSPPGHTPATKKQHHRCLSAGISFHWKAARSSKTA